MALQARNADYNFDVAIIGSGAAGLTAALHLPRNAKIALLSKGPIEGGSTDWAQGGIAAVVDKDDTADSHVKDTLIAGAGLCDEDAVRFIIENSAAAIRELDELGVQFTREGNDYHLTREGGHSHRRVVHAADETGHAVEHTLVGRVSALKNVTVFEQFTAVDLICERPTDTDSGTKPRCVGFYALDKNEVRVVTFAAKVVILATGGAAKVYPIPPIPTATRAMASRWRGAPVAGSPTWNSPSSIRRACIIRRPSRSSFPKPCAAKADACCYRTASRSCSASTNGWNWHRAISSRAPSTTR